MPRVLQVATASATLYSFVEYQAEALRDHGYEVEFACSSADFEDVRSYSAELKAHGWIVHDIPFARSISPASDFSTLLQLIRLLRAGHYDIIHTHTSKAGLIGRVAGAVARVPIRIHTAHDFHFMLPMPFYKKWAFVSLEAGAAKLCTEMFFVSEGVLNIARKYKLKSPEKLVLIGNGVDLSSFTDVTLTKELLNELSIPAGAPVVGVVARMVWYKRINLFLAVAAALVQQVPNIHFIVVGDGPERANLEALSDSLGIRSVVHFMGFRQDSRDVPRLMSQMDVFFLPTIKEGFGMVFAEAMALQKPVVAVDASPMNEIIAKDKTGLLLPQDSAPAVFAQSIAQLLLDNERRIQMGKNGRRRVEDNFARAVVINRLLSAYKQAIDQRAQ